MVDIDITSEDVRSILIDIEMVSHSLRTDTKITTDNIMTTVVADELPLISTLSDKLVRARCRLLTRMPWYGYVAMHFTWRPSNFDWIQSEKRKTMGVRIIRSGVIECLWYPGFVHSQSLEQLYSVIYHEIDHIVRVHCIRMGTERDPEAWNIACDMTINGKRSNPMIGYIEPETNKRILPLNGECVWVPEDWEYGLPAEVYYNRIVKNQPLVPCAKCGGAGCSAPDCPHDDSKYSYGGFTGEVLDDHSIWRYTEVSQDEARQIVNDITTQATAKSQGHYPGHLGEALKELQKPIVHWRENFKQYIGRYVGNRRGTYSRRNRRKDEFGVRGVSRHAASKVRVIVDTSGSMSIKELSHAFTEIEAMSSYAEIKVLLWDHNFQFYDKYRRGDWKKWTMRGRGGTDMAAPVKWLVDNKQLGDCQILITDGFCNWPNPQPWFPDMGMITVITNPDPVPPTWGQVVRLSVN